MSEYGLQTQRNDCNWLVLDGKGRPPLHWQQTTPSDTYVTELQRMVVISCAVTDRPPLAPEESTRRSAIDRQKQIELAKARNMPHPIGHNYRKAEV